MYLGMCMFVSHCYMLNTTHQNDQHDYKTLCFTKQQYIQSTPLEITIQAGEFEVFKSICQTSIPYLLGWNTCMDIASAAAISKGLSGGGGMY